MELTSNFLCSLYQHENKFYIIIHSGWSLAYILMKERVNRPLDKSVYSKNNFLISQPKHVVATQ